MRHSLRLLLAALVLLVVASAISFAPAGPVEAGMLCQEGTFDYGELHCYLGIHRDCTECWVY